MTMLVKHECQFCKFDAVHKKPCKGCGEQHNTPEGFKSFLNEMFPNLSDKDIDPTVRAYSAHKTQPDMIHQAEHAMMSGKKEGMEKKPKDWTASKSYISKLYDTDGCIYCKTGEVFKKRKLPTHQHLEAYRNAHHDALNNNPEFQKMSKEQKNEQLAAVEHDVKIFEIHGRKPNDVHDMIDHIKRERKIDEKNAAVMSVSSPKTGETCNCETGDHANSGGQEHGMFNQDIGRQNWQGQGLPQPKQDKDGCQCDEKPSEANKVPNADARLGDDEDEKKKATWRSDLKPKKPDPKQDWSKGFDLGYKMGLTNAKRGDMKVYSKRTQEENKSYCQCEKAEDDAPDIEPISGTSTGSGGKLPKKYSKKPSADNPKGIISEEWKKHRAAQRVARGEKKRRLQSDKLMENMSPDVKLNYERNMKDLNPKPDKRSVRNTNRKPMSQEKLHERKTKLTGRKRRKKMWLQIKAILNRLKTERGDGTWGQRGLGDGNGTAAIQGSGQTHLISPVKQEELDKLMAGARYLPRSVSRKKKP